MIYDSTQDTKAHVARVRELLMQVINDLGSRYWAHDRSKFEEPEKSMFDEFTPKLRSSTYGTPEYKKLLKQMGPALQHHYAACDHHPEHFENGIHGMGLPQLMETLADWKAAGERHATGGDLRASIEANAERFGYSDELKQIFLNTALYFGWIEPEVEDG